MTKKQIITRVTAFAILVSFSTTHVFADINLGNQDGTGFSSGTSNNYWGVHTDSGTSLNETEGLRVTIYDAETNNKVFNTIDISGNSNISAVSDMNYFADGNELISKTTWLNYVGSVYNSVSPSDMTRFNNIVTSKNCFGSDYNIQYVAELSSVDIVSANNIGAYRQKLNELQNGAVQTDSANYTQAPASSTQDEDFENEMF